jgi:hypothetical protein
MFDPEVGTILEAVPEFVSRYLEMVDGFDGDPGAQATFAELAEYAARLVLELERYQPVLVRTMAGVEHVARSSDDAVELVGWAFLDNLSPDELRCLRPWMGPETRRVLDGLELPELPEGRGAPLGAPLGRTKLERLRVLRVAPGGTGSGWSLGG